MPSNWVQSRNKLLLQRDYGEVVVSTGNIDDRWYDKFRLECLREIDISVYDSLIENEILEE